MNIPYKNIILSCYPYKNMTLEDLHRNERSEYRRLIEEFNILFYGYGDKEKILHYYYPRAIFINCLNKTQNEIMKELAYHLNCEIFDFYNEIRTDEILIFLNFNIKKLDFITNGPQLKIIGTIESYEHNLTEEDISSHSFILRDLTTYVPYTLVDQKIVVEDKLKNIFLLLNNLPAKTVWIFKIFLDNYFQNGRKIDLAKVFARIKRDLLISDVNSINQQLVEFYEHKYMKREGSEIKFNITYAVLVEIREELKSFKF